MAFEKMTTMVNMTRRTVILDDKGNKKITKVYSYRVGENVSHHINDSQMDIRNITNGKKDFFRHETPLAKEQICELQVVDTHNNKTLDLSNVPGLNAIPCERNLTFNDRIKNDSKIDQPVNIKIISGNNLRFKMRIFYV